MAYAAVASLLQTVDIFLDYHEHSISPQFNDQITSVHKHACSLHTFLEEGSSDRVNNWEETIREVTDRAEQIIELLLSDLLLKKSGVGSSEPESEKRKKYEVHYSYDELEKVAGEIESIARKVKAPRRIATVDDSDCEVMELVSRLRGGSAALEALAICGSEGMGKTTLANKAYYHPLIVEHFDIRAWSHVTGDYNPVRVIEDFLRCVKAEYSVSNAEDELVERLSQILGSRKFFIWLDDVWSFEVLERLKMMLPDYGNGSRIIVTTQSCDLANCADHVHEMRLFDVDKTWNVLRDTIFEGDPCPSQLESIGKTIAGSCKGHRLSIAVVCGILLASDQTEAAWADVLENIKIASEEDNNDKVDEILYLSYLYLPHHLRPCFLYLGIFPLGHWIHVSTLVKMWVAEGFVNEETGEEYVEDLVRRSLVSVNRYKSNGRISIIRVHDLIRGMCLRQARIDNFNLHLDRCTPRSEIKELIKLCRRVSTSIQCDDFFASVYGSTIRTLFFCLKHGKLDLRCWMGNVRLLRVLSLLDVDMCDMCGEVFELFHPRYLSFHSEFGIPEAVSILENLQTLIIHHEKIGGVFDKLPEGIWRMSQLKHLYVVSFKFPNKEGPTSVLENLQTLSQAVDFVCSRENLKMIPHLRKLALLYTKNWRDVVEDSELHNLIYLPQLEALKLETISSFEEECKMSYATFPSTLKKLSLRALQLSWEDMKIVASLPNLEVLKLRNHACVGETWETSEGGFSRLVSLRIEESGLKNWITKCSHFPRLRWLLLVRCSSLLEIPYEMAEIPTLQRIYFDETNHSLLRSVKRIQQDRHSLGHDPLRIRPVL